MQLNFQNWPSYYIAPSNTPNDAIITRYLLAASPIEDLPSECLFVAFIAVAENACDLRCNDWLKLSIDIFFK